MQKIIKTENLKMKYGIRLRSFVTKSNVAEMCAKEDFWTGVTDALERGADVNSIQICSHHCH